MISVKAEHKPFGVSERVSEGQTEGAANGLNLIGG